MSTIKAVRATITLGDIELDVFQLPDGKYFLSVMQLAESIGISHKRFAEFRELKLAQSLYPEGFRMAEKVKVEGGTKPVSIISLDDVSKYWTLAAFQTQNQIAIALLAASQTEALERRADNAFNVIRTEKERNERFVTRRDGILSRHFWTDCIEHYCKTHEVSDNYKKFVYIHVSDYLNKALFGMNSKQLLEHYDLISGSPRDYFPSETLKLIDTIEKATAVRVDKNDVCPKQALKDVVGMLGIEPDLTLL
ncbi:MAG: hypothetical protein ACRDBG_13830 [Waterburya sp.]